ncbi:MAG: hypothetical protein U0802_15070 [Candidatus Binatia bacterium]
MAVAEIARRLDLDRKTVRRCLRQESWQAYRRAARSNTLLATHAAFLRERAPAVRYSARILFQELRQAHGYAGSYETVKLFVRRMGHAAHEPVGTGRVSGGEHRVTGGHARRRATDAGGRLSAAQPIAR